MSDLFDRVPATIPGLLDEGHVSILVRRGTEAAPVWVPGVWLGWKDDAALLNYEALSSQFDNGYPEDHEDVPLTSVWVDLTDRTSRVHAAWWVIRRSAEWTFYEENALDNACSGSDMSAQQIDTLARLVLRLAEVTGE